MSTFTEYRLGGIAGDLLDAAGLDAAGDRPEQARKTRTNVLIYRNELIERSETFILAQAAAMERYHGIFCGIAQKPDGILPGQASRSLLMYASRDSRLRNFLQKRAFMATGFAPAWKARCKTYRPGLLHAHFGVDAAFALPLHAALDVPLVVSLHGYDVTSSVEALRRSAGGRLYLRRREELFARAELFICVSRFIRDQAIERGYPREKLWVHSIGIDLETFRTDDSVQRQPIVLFVGRLVEKKGCGHLIAAMRAVQRALPATRLVIIGDGPLRQKLQAQAAQSLSGEYTFLGSQPPEIVRSWLLKAKVFCVPSVTAANGDQEGLGMVFCEAQAMGVPVASFASGGIPEAVLDGKTGYLSPEKDETGLTESICRLLKDSVLWTEMSRRGQERVKQCFDLRLQTRLLESKYDQVLAGLHCQGAAGYRFPARRPDDAGRA